MRLGAGGVDWADGTFVQAYASFEDRTKPGIYKSFTCNTEYRTDQGFARTKMVRSYEGSISLANSQTDKWNNVARTDMLPESEETWKLVDGNREVDYQSTFEYPSPSELPVSWQYCAAEAILYDATDGTASDQ